MTLTKNQVRILLAGIAACGAGVLATFLFGGSLLGGELELLRPVLMAVLAIGAVGLPMLGMAGSLADPRRVRSVGFLVVPLLSLAVFLDDRFNVFPARILCLVGLILAFLGTLVVLFTAMSAGEAHRSSGRPS